MSRGAAEFVVPHIVCPGPGLAMVQLELALDVEEEVDAGEADAA